MSLPEEFLARLRTLVPPERLDTVLVSFAEPKTPVVWVNPLRDDGTALSRLIERGATLTPLSITPAGTPESGQAYVVTGLHRDALTHDETLAPLWFGGALYLINPSSLLPPAALAAEPGEQVLDLCAAPGGKAIQLAARLFAHGADGGHLAAVEAVKPRFFKLKALLERYGAPTDRVRLFLKDGRDVGGAVPERFDRVLIDAPCSSEARFDSHDDSSVSHWNARKLAECAHKQRGLLRSGLESLKVGGTLVYSTCSFAPEENEAVVRDVLATCGESVMVEPVVFPDAVPTMPGVDLEGGVRVLPDAVWDGFFLVRLRKVASLPDASVGARGGQASGAGRPQRPGRSERDISPRSRPDKNDRSSRRR